MDAIAQRLSLPAFRSRNYRLFFGGQGISLIGTWMPQIATVWLVYHLTHSATFWDHYYSSELFIRQLPLMQRSIRPIYRWLGLISVG